MKLLNPPTTKPCSYHVGTSNAICENFIDLRTCPGRYWDKYEPYFRKHGLGVSDVYDGGEWGQSMERVICEEMGAESWF